jgi:hypothetical protein
MIINLLKILIVNILLLPGELGFTVMVMLQEYEYSHLALLCTAGLLFSANSIVTGGYLMDTPKKEDPKGKTRKDR